jgi:hypothetical protein
MSKSSVIVFIGCALVANSSLAEAPGVKALAISSTDIVVVSVVSTSPTKAVEGARDTVTLTVVRCLKGPRKEGDVIPLYYHLLWVDMETGQLEPKKFEKGKEYLVFLKAQTVIKGDGKKVLEYELTDQWLSVQPVHPHLEKEILNDGKASDNATQPSAR